MIIAQSCPTLCDPMDYSPPGSSLCGTLQARILERVAISFFKGNILNAQNVNCIKAKLLQFKEEMGGKARRVVQTDFSGPSLRSP